MEVTIRGHKIVLFLMHFHSINVNPVVDACSGTQIVFSICLNMHFLNIAFIFTIRRN